MSEFSVGGGVVAPPAYLPKDKGKANQAKMNVVFGVSVTVDYHLTGDVCVESGKWKVERTVFNSL